MLSYNIMYGRFYIEECNSVPVELWVWSTYTPGHGRVPQMCVCLSNYFCNHWYQEEVMSQTHPPYPTPVGLPTYWWHAYISRGLRLVHYLKLTLNSNPVESCLPITSISFAQSFCNFVQSPTVSILCYMEYLKIIWPLRNKLGVYEFLQELSLRWFKLKRDTLYCSGPHVLVGGAGPQRVAVHIWCWLVWGCC